MMSLLTFSQAVALDADALVELRVLAMRESLERIGRFDPARARQRFLSTFEPSSTWHIELKGQRIGFFAVRAEADHLLLDHLYVRPGYQGRRLGEAVLSHVFARADRERKEVRVGALIGSDSNRFYLRHGFSETSRSEFDIYYTRPCAGR
jgi:GNAT superfamily N-acetyltransferase